MKTLLSILSILIAVGTASASYAETTLKELQDKGVVRLGFANEAPYSFTAPNGDLAGVDYEVMKIIFDKLGVPKIEGVLTPFSSLIPGLKSNRFDIVGTGLYIRPDRCKQVAFSEPTIVVASAMIVPIGNPKNLHSFADLAKDPSLTLGHVVGGTNTTAEADGVKPEQFKSFADVITTVSALKSGRVDAVLRTYIDAVDVVRKAGDGKLEVAQPFTLPIKDGSPMQNYAGYAFRPEDKGLLQAFNAELVKILSTPTHKAILDKYNILQPDYPFAKDTAKVCGG